MDVDEKRHTENTISIIHGAACAYMRGHHLTRDEFAAEDDRHRILEYVEACPSRFDALPEEEMLRELDEYVRMRA